MTKRTETELVLDRYLAEGPEVVPDRVLDAALDEIDHTKQRRSWAPWRAQPMTPNLRPALAGLAAAVIVVVAVIWLRPSPSGNVGAPSRPPTASPTVPASVTPSASASPSAGSVLPLGLGIVGLEGALAQDLGLPQDAWMPDLSADGTKVAFVTGSPDLGFCGACGLDSRVAILDVGAAGGFYLYGGGEGVPDTLDDISQPVWSPEGDRLAFRATGPDGNVDIYVATLGASGPTDQIPNSVYARLTTDPAADEFPAWSPDGQTILYDNLGATAADGSGFSPTQEIWSVPAAGGTPTRLTTNDVPDSNVDVAADGRVAVWRDGSIWTMDLDGSKPARLEAVPAGLGFAPRWSPDGTQIALLRFIENRRAHFPEGPIHGSDLPLLEVLIVDLDSGSVTDLGVTVASDVNSVSWLPDGTGLLVNRYDDD